MRIYILEVDKRLQPDSQPISYPSFNDDYGVEQDFMKYLSIHKELVVNNPGDASWRRVANAGSQAASEIPL